MKVVLLVGDQPSQRALSHRVAAQCDLAAVFVSRNVPRRPPPRSWRRLVNRVSGRLFGWPFVHAWFGVQDRYRSLFAEWPAVDVRRVDNVNEPAVVEALERMAPGLVMVSGTTLVGKSVIAAASRGGRIVNLHTGISPYVKGGPNCTNGCLAQGWFHLIGNTVMWLDPGIDSGPLIATERTDLDGHESLLDLQWKVLEHAHNLYVRVARAVASGRSLPRIAQEDVGEGRTFFNADWSAGAMVRGLWNYHRHFRPETLSAAHKRTPEVRLFPFTPG